MGINDHQEYQWHILCGLISLFIEILDDGKIRSVFSNLRSKMFEMPAVEEDVVVETSNPEKVSSSDLLDDYDVRVVNGSMHDACVL